jgi:hypothetical protein
MEMRKDTSKELSENHRPKYPNFLNMVSLTKKIYLRNRPWRPTGL